MLEQGKGRERKGRKGEEKEGREGKGRKGSPGTFSFLAYKGSGGHYTILPMSGSSRHILHFLTVESRKNVSMKAQKRAWIGVGVKRCWSKEETFMWIEYIQESHCTIQQP